MSTSKTKESVLPIRLNVADVIAAARKAYKEHRLQAQRGRGRCTYRSRDGYPCAIGAALTDEQVAALNARGDTDQPIDMAIAFGEVAADNANALKRIQWAHDCWRQRQKGRTAKAFLATLEEIEAGLVR